MKTLFYYISALIFLSYSQLMAQEQLFPQDSKEDWKRPHLFGFQSSILINNLYYEVGIVPNLSLRTEATLTPGFNINLSSNNANLNSEYTLSPGINLEPRYYFNKAKRERKGKNIDKSSASYVSIKNMWISSNNLFSSDTRSQLQNTILILPSIGLRRNYGVFEFEVGLGVGPSWTENIFNGNMELGLAILPHLRIGANIWSR
ncbi:MAG: hypothetical protein LAT68_09305 [Cyclobacteriaceae bacterium]|nr:hypothetical protein [Cyclobacteriaceae bacterium]MCH8516510.1 hypothetical protein [Cyclobacteriaceae bacterium]